MSENSTPQVDLLARIGGEPVIDKVINVLYGMMLSDKRLGSLFSNSDVDQIKRMQKKFLMLVFSNQNIPKFTRKSITKSHKRLNLTDIDFDNVKIMIARSLVKVGVSTDIADLAMAATETIRNEILGRETDKNLSEFYVKLGGNETVDACIDLVYELAMKDPLLYPQFKKAKVDHIKKMFKKFSYHLFNGTSYNGRGMRHAHSQLEIKDEHFDAMKKLFQEALVTLKVDDDSVIEALNIVERLRFEVLSTDIYKGDDILMARSRRNTIRNASPLPTKDDNQKEQPLDVGHLNSALPNVSSDQNPTQ
ncbi:globin-like protein [Globomyces pollinis-pini]|nr:globin-like protein [Globomyces pollinis-pini]